MQIDVSQLVNVGAIGVVLAWFMLRAEKKLDEGAYKVEAIPDMAEYSAKRFEYFSSKPKNK